MTVRELIDVLGALGTDVADYEVKIIATMQLPNDIRITARCGVAVKGGIDTDAEVLWLKAHNLGMGAQ